MNKKPGSLIVTTLDGSRSCYITTNRIAFLSVETILARTIDISNNILNCFGTPFKNVNPCSKRQQKGICLIFKKNIAHLTHRRTLRTLIITSAERLKSLFVQAKFTQTLCIWTIHAPMIIMALLSYAQSALHIVIALKNVTLETKKNRFL